MSLAAGATIGILGGGQLGRMLATAGANLGFDVHIFSPETNAPAARVAARHWCHAYDSAEPLADFAAACDVVTVEFENIPVETVEAITAAGGTVLPGAQALRVAQDRSVEKRFLEDLGIKCAPWRPIDSLDALQAGLAELGPEAILKTRRDGYDGKGQVRLTRESDVAAAWQALGASPCVLEGLVGFACEVSAIVVRSRTGEMATYPIAENTHEGGILRRSIAPARVSRATADLAAVYAKRLADALDYVGVLAVEFFVLPDDELLANEFAPRVHNSGHWTPEATPCGQFENHMRAVAGWPLGDTDLDHPVEMENLIGADASAPPETLLQSGRRLTLYGKHEIRAGRKMGHTVRRLKT